MYVIQLHSWRILKHMRSILLTDGEFTGMIRALRALPFPVRIVGFVSSDRAAHTAMLDASYVPPSGNGDAYYDFLTEIIRKEGIDTVFPIVTLDLEYIAERAAEIEKLTGARVITPSPEAVRVLNNKYLLYEALKEDGILGPSVPGYARVLTFGELRSAVRDFSGRNTPCVIKPVRGENAEGFLRLIDRREYEERVLSGNPEHLASLDIFDSHDDEEKLPGERLVMPYLPGREYDVDTVSEDGKLLAVTMRENAEMYGGLSACTKTCFNEKLLLYVKRLADMFRLSGLACISFREDENGEIKLLEVNPRAMGSISMSAICGNNLLEYILCGKKEAPKEPVITRAGVTASLYNDLITVIDEEREEWRRFEEIDRERYEWFHGKVRTRMTDLTYSCRLAWNRKYDIRWTVMEDCLVMISDADAYMLMPLGDYDAEKLRRITDRVRSYFISRGLPFQILCIDGSKLSLFEKLGYSGAELSFSEDYSDYLYNADDLRTLKGRKYSGKRNHLAHFLNLYPDYEYRSLTPEYFAECLALAGEWSAEHGAGIDDTDASDYRMIEAVFDSWDRTGCRGGMIRIGGKIRAFSIGSVHGDTAFIHFEKADTAYEGLYAAINRMTLENEFPEVIYVNREEDMGIEGLRAAKESYYPCERIRKYRMTFKRS